MIVAYRKRRAIAWINDHFVERFCKVHQRLALLLQDEFACEGKRKGSLGR